jgi:hypothetical protein
MLVRSHAHLYNQENRRKNRGTFGPEVASYSQERRTPEERGRTWKNVSRV